MFNELYPFFISFKSIIAVWNVVVRVVLSKQGARINVALTLPIGCVCVCDTRAGQSTSFSHVAKCHLHSCVAATTKF